MGCKVWADKRNAANKKKKMSKENIFQKVSKLQWETEPSATKEELAKVCSLLTELTSRKDELPAREDVARLAKAYNFWACVGGRHVSIHINNAGQAGKRLGIFTGNYGDWN